MSRTAAPVTTMPARTTRAASASRRSATGPGVWEGAPGTSLPEMNRVTGLVVQELRAIPGVRNVGAHVGRAISSDQSTDVNGGEIWVNLDPAVDQQTAVAAIQEVVDGYPGLHREVLTYSDERLREILSGSPDAAVVRLYGQDLGILRAKAEEVRTLIGGIEGVVDPHVSTLIEEPNVEIEVDLAKAQEAGVKPGDVRRAAATLLSGMEFVPSSKIRRCSRWWSGGGARDTPQRDQRPRVADRYAWWGARAAG